VLAPPDVDGAIFHTGTSSPSSTNRTPWPECGADRTHAPDRAMGKRPVTWLLW
jgi:hypothetical protein